MYYIQGTNNQWRSVSILFQTPPKAISDDIFATLIIPKHWKIFSGSHEIRPATFDRVTSPLLYSRGTIGIVRGWIRFDLTVTQEVPVTNVRGMYHTCKKQTISKGVFWFNFRIIFRQYQMIFCNTDKSWSLKKTQWLMWNSNPRSKLQIQEGNSAWKNPIWSYMCTGVSCNKRA